MPPSLQIHELVRAELPWQEEDAAALAQRCFISSAVLSAPDAQQPCATPAQGALHPSRGGKRAEEAPLPLPWQQLLWWLNGLLKGFVAGTFVKHQLSTQTCSVISAPNYSQGTFWGFVVGCFLFQNRLLLFVVSSAESPLMAG